MNIDKKKLEIEIEGGKFIFNDADINVFEKIIEAQKKTDFRTLYQLTMDHLIGIENVFSGDKELTLDEFKSASISSAAAIRIPREYIEALNKNLLSEFGLDKRQAEKNDVSLTA